MLDVAVQAKVIVLAGRTVPREWSAEVGADALIQAVRDRHRAYRDFFDEVGGRKGVRAGKPGF
ncbi:hypothetical protein [Umezawaea sp. Da 62-37]|uniref:hypothetical protein n=1 Tax=Umezawaea sp. Da 62-37 TaxID=3075927 RepID=UPI0028F7328C|nr:hypothetical protein [Umezawaea sp. Da 62-37]WNV82379.1 hypothetical protein RM788_29740 [Umezawaea sp. Da 62-37]